MDPLLIEQTDKEKERSETILPDESGTHSHPYCDKTDSHWFRVGRDRLGFGSGAYEVERDVEVYSYECREDGGRTVKEPLGRTNVFYFIAPQLVTFVGVIKDKETGEDTAYILSRPAEKKKEGWYFLN